VSGREIDGLQRTGKVDANGDDSFEVRGKRPIEDLVQVVGERWHVQVAMGVDERIVREDGEHHGVGFCMSFHLSFFSRNVKRPQFPFAQLEVFTAVLDELVGCSSWH
jgi:hypothetical protein